MRRFNFWNNECLWCVDYNKDLMSQMGLDATKPISFVSDKARLKQVSSATETSYKSKKAQICPNFQSLWLGLRIIYICIFVLLL